MGGQLVLTIAKWNNTELPIAYLITFRSYGTWLAGDERGSIDKYHNSFGGPRAVTSKNREMEHNARLKGPPFLLNAARRQLVEHAIRDVCSFRAWTLIALNVRTNHVHIVVSGQTSSGKILGDLRAYSTRHIRERNAWNYEQSPWADKGSRRSLWTEEHVGAASDHVINGQGDQLPKFD